MNWCDAYIAVDWGTTNRRAYLVASDGAVTARFEDDRGLLAIPAGTFEAEVAAIRARLGDWPMLLAGMVGAKGGWREVPYVACPAGPEELVAGVLWVDPGRTGIVPGVAQRGAQADVMRGEEVQLVGAIAGGFLPRDGLACHPGTHAKWIVAEGGAIARFRTTMTGEFYALLRKHSILASQLQDEVQPGAAFRACVEDGLQGGSLLADLFGVRARYVLGVDDGNSASRVSGMLIGCDVRAGLELHEGGPIGLIGQPALCRLYADALAVAGHETTQIEGESAFLAGIGLLAEML
jgi:2-dehydro-3-deoxygalactonokinase